MILSADRCRTGRWRNRTPIDALAGTMNDKVHDEASDVEALDGRVVVDGPDGVAVLLTPDAALETSDRLHEAAVTAQGQKVIADKEER
jgi:hypothetical protein